MSPQDYLTWEAGQPLRYGYINGQVDAMTGGTIPHNQIAVNLVALIKLHLRGNPLDEVYTVTAQFSAKHESSISPIAVLRAFRSSVNQKTPLPIDVVVMAANYLSQQRSQNHYELK